MSGPPIPWQDQVDLRLEAAVSPGRPMKWGPLPDGDNDARLNSGRVWGPWTVAPGNPSDDSLWVDISPSMVEMQWTGGALQSDTVFPRWEAAQMRAVFYDPALLFDPTNPTSPWFSRTVPNVPIRIRGGYRPAPGEPATTMATLFQGFVDSWNPSWDADPEDRYTQVTATDGTRILSGFDSDALPSVVGAGETAAQRVARILNHAGWPADDRDIIAGGTIMQGTDHAQPAWTELLLVADTDLGFVWLDPAGKLSYRTGQFIRDAIAGDPMVVFGTDGLDCMLEATPSFTAESIRNIVSGSNGTTTAQVADEASIERYRGKTYRRTDLQMRDSSALTAWLNQVLTMGANPSRHIGSILFDPTRAPEAFRWLLVPAAFDVWQIRWTPPGDETSHTVVENVTPGGWVHTVTADSWETQVNTGILTSLGMQP